MICLTPVRVLIYVDDAVIFTHAENVQEASCVLTSAMTHVQTWFTESCLLINAKKTVCMMFSKWPTEATHSNVYLNGKELGLVKEFKYLGVVLDPPLTFKNHVKKISNTIKFNLQNF